MKICTWTHDVACCKLYGDRAPFEPHVIPASEYRVWLKEDPYKKEKDFHVCFECVDKYFEKFPSRRKKARAFRELKLHRRRERLEQINVT
jgi:hypothetical protein